MSPQASSTLPVGSASADSWDEVIETRAGVPINELIDGLDDIAALAIPYARLPRRAYNVFSAQFASWSDIAGQTLSALLSRPKAGEGTVRALLTAAADASKPPNAFPIDLTITSGALTAAVASIEPSNTAMDEASSGRPRSITLAKCSACGVSRRSSKRALIPTRSVANPRHQTENLVKLPLRLDMHHPDLQIRLKPPRRIHVPAAQLRFDLWQRLDTQGGNLRGDDDERTIRRQSQTTGDFPQAPAIENSRWR